MTAQLDVLIVNLYYPPDTSATAGVFADLAAALQDRGHCVSVLTGRPSYEPAERRRWRLLARETTDQVAVERVGSTAMDRGRRGGRAANYISFMILAAGRALMRRRPDVVISGSDPFLCVWVGWLAARGRPLIYSIQDVNPDAGVVAGLIKARLTTRLWDGLHRLALKLCTQVVCLGDTMRQRLIEKGASPERIVVIPTGTWPASGTPDPEIVRELRGDKEFLVVHAGNIGAVGAWDAVLAAANSLDEAAEFLFVGEGVEADRLRGAGVRVTPFRPKQEIPSVMKAGDLQLVSLKAGLEGLVVPSKVYSILAHGRPVLAVAPEESEIAQVVVEHRCGLVASPEDPSEIVAKIRWARAHPEKLEEMGGRAYEAAKAFHRGHQLDRFVESVEEVVHD